MYLKRLLLHGFKSFASRTSFDFGHGITAIVGPNGSGKSNISDSLRWVLGEQSGRLLRAKKLDDIIYAGSAKRAAGDKVEVTIVLDNEDRWLPLESEEVTISRKGARSGDSEYFINGRRARLRDVQLLLAGANVTQSSYAIIGQGLVENILTLRPEERRELIEEAADIQKYRLKIEEAHARLHSTHENVERVRLLIKEIAPRLAQLERQARRAGEHQELSQQLKQALRVYYEEQWHSSHEGLTVARATHDQMQAEFTQARVALDTCQRELNDITQQLEEQRQAASAALAEKDRLDQKIRDVERRVAVARERAGILEARQKELRDEVAAVQEERNKAEGVLTSHESRRAELARLVDEARKVFDARQAELTALEREFRESHMYAVEAEAKAKRLEAAAAEMKGRIRRLTDGQRDLEREASRLENRRRSLVSQMAEQLRVTRGLRAKDMELLADVAQISVRRQALETEVRELRESLARLDATQNGRRAKLEALEARLSVISDAQQRASAYGDPEAAVSIEGALATLYEVIRVPRELEEAIASALADQLEAFIFEHEGQALSAIQSLVSQRGPRTFVLPLDAVKQVYPLNLMREKGVVGVASQLVKCLPQYERIVNSLLGRTIIVQDMQTAARVARRRLGTVVTLDGVVFHPGGYVSGGQPRASRPFVLGYERDMESIPKEIDRTRRSLAVAEREAESLRARLKHAEGVLSGQSREAESALDRRVKIQDGLSQRQQRLAQLRGELRSLIDNRQALLDRQSSYQQQTETLGHERTALLQEAAEAMETTRHLEKGDRLFKDRRQAMQKTVNEAADALARADGELRTLTVQKENANATLARLQAQTSAKEVQLRGLEMELSTLHESIGTDAKQMAGAQAQMDSLLKRVTPGQEGAHHLEARQRDLHSQVLSSQKRLFESERRLLESEADVRRWETQIETLRGRIAEDGLVLTEDGGVKPEEQPQVPYWLAVEGTDDASGIRPISGGARVDPAQLGAQIERLRAQLRALGPVNVEAQTDYESLKERHDFLSGQVRDLEGAEESLHRAIEELTGLMRKRFESTFALVAASFEENFHAFFGGGHAKLRLTEPKNPSSSGVEIEARPPGKRTHALGQLSGGEKALTSLSLLFALLQANPSPFCVLDEVDAMLDEANVVRFAGALKGLAERTQFIVITHNRRTIEIADSIYGVSMAPDAASRVLSMRLADVASIES